MGSADQEANALLYWLEDQGAGSEDLGDLERISRDPKLRRSRRRRALELIAAIGTDEAAAAAVGLVLEPWVGSATHGAVVERLCEQERVVAVITLAGSGRLAEHVEVDVALAWLKSLPERQLVPPLEQYLRRPEGFEPISLQGLMRLLASVGDAAGETLRELAFSEETSEVVRAEALVALERVRPDVLPSAAEMTPVTETIVFYGTRFSLPSFEHHLAAFAQSHEIEYEARIEGGLLLRELHVTLRARMSKIGDLVTYARAIKPTSGTSGPGIGLERRGQAKIGPPSSKRGSPSVL